MILNPRDTHEPRPDPVIIAPRHAADPLVLRVASPPVATGHRRRYNVTPKAEFTRSTLADCPENKLHKINISSEYLYCVDHDYVKVT